MSSFVLFILLASKLVVADIPECTGGAIQFDPPENPDDSNKYTWYPNNFTGTQPPMFPNDYTCTYKINVPINWSAMVVMTLNLTTPPQDGAISVQVIDHNQRSEQVASADNEHYFFIANGGRIQLATRESNVIFGFAVKWTKLPRNFASFNDNVTISQSQPVVYWAFSTYPIQIRAETKVSLVITPPVEDELMQYLRSIIIYDGPDWNSTSLGTGLQLFAGKRQYVSSGSYMTVQQLAPAFPLGRTMLVFQDYENTKDIVEYQGATCARVENCGQFLMDGSIGMAAVTTVNERSDSGAECVNSMSGSGDLDVYIGGKTKSKSNLIASYQIGDDSNKLPQEFLGYVRTYVLTGNNAKVYTSRNCQSFYNSGVVGRKGFFASRFYKSGVNSGMQSVYESIKSSTGLSKNRVNFSFTIKEADFVGNTTMEVTVYDNGKESYRQLFTAKNQPNLNSKIEKLGDEFSVNYKTYNYETKGFYLEFEILKSSSRYGIFGLFIIVFMYLF